jgi:folate-binding Fe-S cluster repair protein YgfZ
MSDLLNYVTEQVVSDYDRLRESCARVELDYLSILSLTGEDRKGWLQGQVTNNLRNFENGNSTAFCFCEVSGHLLAACDAWMLADRTFLLTDTQTAPAVLNRAVQMVIMEDVVAEDVSKSYKLISIQGPKASARLTEFVDLPKLDAGTSELEGAEVFVLRSNRTGLGGWDILVPATKRKAIKTLREAFTEASPEAYEVARIEGGVPRYGMDMNGRTLPPEMGLAFVQRHISYNKGCYVGQEILMRMHSRGHTNRTWVGLVAEKPLPVGSTVSHLRREDAGIITSYGYSPDFGAIAGAMLRNEAAFDREIVRVNTPDGPVEAEVRPMPLLRFE